MSDPRLDVPADAVGLEALLPGYAVTAAHFDELSDPGGRLRPQWQAFARAAGAFGRRQLTEAQARIDRQLHENGVTYNVYASADGPARPWTLDVVPFVISGDEWAVLARGLRQRARLLDRVAADLYGPQQLLDRGLVPPALVLAHPGFQRPCHGMTPPGGVWLHHVAFDLARAPDGAWRVIGTRTQSPSGTGYALENRVAISRVFPNTFRQLHVQPIAPFFQRLQDILAATAPTGGEPPHVVLLTPGPFNETHFEHAYLARQLGFTLAEGSDLAVRNDRVYLKTVTGLRRVHAILRRLDDDFCDPVELRADSTLGVAGLVQAWRSGGVLIANALGTGVVETPALFAFLPAIAEQLLGEPLLVPSVATWWSGERAALEAVRARAGGLILKQALPHRLLEPVFLAELDAPARASWLQRVEAAPDSFVFEEYLPLSQAPCWHESRLESRAAMLRVYLVADGGGDYAVLPGGLTRIAGADRHVVSSQRGGSSKDTWVLGEAPVERPGQPALRVRLDDPVHARVVSSRAAEHLFWLGRYAERSEQGARLLRAALSRVPDADDFSTAFWRAVRQVATGQGLIRSREEGAQAAPRPASRLSVADLALEDEEATSGLASSVRQTVRVAGAVRDRLSSDNWRLLRGLGESLERPADGLVETLELLDRTVVSLVAVAGLEMAHMTRDDGWRFLSLGRHLERSLSVAATLGDALASGDLGDPHLLEWLLDLSDGVITYRARYRRVPDWASVSELLVFDDTNPRALVFQLGKLAKHVALLPDAGLADTLESLARAAAVRAPADAWQGELFDHEEPLGLYLADCRDLALRLSDGLTLRYFSHAYELSQATAVL